MKKLIFPLIALCLFSLDSLAASPKDKSFKFCDDITQVDKLLDRSRETVNRIRSEGLNVDRIVVSKDRRQLYLVSGDVLLRTFPVAFGWSYIGHKQFEGDGKTPEGIYTIDYKKADSQFTKALHVDYPNKTDLEFAKSKGKSAGGMIMVHGFPNDKKKAERIKMFHPLNWTMGCMAVTNEQIEEIFALVKEKTLIEICKVTPEESSTSTPPTQEKPASTASY